LSVKIGTPGPEGQQDPKDPGGFEVVFKAGAGGQTVTISTDRQIVTVDTSKLHFSGELQPKNYVIKVDSDVTHRFQKNDLKLKLTSVITITGIADSYT